MTNIELIGETRKDEFRLSENFLSDCSVAEDRHVLLEVFLPERWI